MSRMRWRWRCAIITSKLGRLRKGNPASPRRKPRASRRCRSGSPLACAAGSRKFMITKLTGILQRVLLEEVRIQAGALEYQVLVPEFVRRVLQAQTGQEVTLHTSHYIEGNAVQGRMVPRLIG